jgi:lipoprotein-anchoring transpeptidase ErfK/SrfK
MFWGRFALRHAVAAGVALAALLYAGPLPLGAGPERATAAGQPAKVNSVTAFGSAPSLGPDGSSPFIVFNASSGTEGTYSYRGDRRRAHTPEGRFAVIRQVDGYRESHLGRLYRPKYFHPNGFAFHGSSFVPPYPASHGCVRLSNAAMDFIWGRQLAPVGSPVWIHGVSPPGKPG